MELSILYVKPLQLDDMQHISKFTSGNNMLDSYIKHYALDDQNNGITSTTLIMYKQEIVGYYSCNSNVLTVDEDEARNLGIQVLSVPAFEIKNFAISKSYQRNGIGYYTFKELLGKLMRIRETISARYLFLWSVEEAVGFYEEKLFFIRMETSNEDGLTLMRLPLIITSEETE